MCSMALESVSSAPPEEMKKIAKFFGLLFGEAPFAHLNGVEPRPVVNLVAVVQVHRLLDRAHVNAGQAPQRLREVAIRPRIILRPER